MTAITREYLDAIDAYCAAATEGPWWRREGHAEIDGQNYAEVLMPGPVNCGSYCYGGSSTIDGDRLDADLAFIAAARTDLPAVVAALRDALARYESLKGRTVGPYPEDACYETHVYLTPCAACERDALAAENARLRAQVQAVEALCDEPEPTKAAWREFIYDGRSGLITDEQHAEYNRAWLRERIQTIRAALATTEAGEES